MRSKHPLVWVPSLYFAEGVPYVVVMTVAVVLYQRLGLSDTKIALYTSWLYLPWVIKPLWSPMVDLFSTKRAWIVAMQVLVGAAMAGVAFTIPTSSGTVKWSLAFFWLMAFSSATHDIAADGFYMLALDSHAQSFYVGLRSLFYRLATIAASGGLVFLGGYFETFFKEPSTAWRWAFLIVAVLFLLLFVWHLFMLPRPSSDERRGATAAEVGKNFVQLIVSFFTKPQIVVGLLFILLYRLPEALLVKICPLFLLGDINNGGLALSPQGLGFAQGTVGVIGLIIGGILGGVLAARNGLRYWLWPMVCAISIPNVVYIFLAYFQPQSMGIISACIGLEQFGYGFGFTAYMLYLIYFSQGEMKTAHYAFCTGLMALGMMLPGMVAGWLAENMGYLNFFILCVALTLVTFAVSLFIRVDRDFGKKTANS